MIKRLIFLSSLLCVFIMLVSAGGSHEDIISSLHQKAAEGDAKALYDLGVLYDRGYDTIMPDSVKSTAYYRLSAEKGYAPAANYLGFRYFNGEGIVENLDSALYWLTTAAAQGDPKAANNLGFLLSHSDKITRDYPQAIVWLTRAADSGLPSAKASLADLLRQGLGTEPDTLRALALYTAAIEAGLRDAELKLLSMMGRKWENIPSDSALALGRFYYTHNAPFIGVTLFENAATDNNPEALALLGDAYSRGLGVEYNHARSLTYFLEAALAEQPSAEFIIAELLDMFPDALDTPEAGEIITNEYGDSPPEDIFSAQYWYEKAALQDIRNAETAYDRLLKSPSRPFDTEN